MRRTFPMRIGRALAVAALCGRAGACDITGWPSTTHHPAPVRLLPAAEIASEYTLATPLPEEVVQDLRAAVRTATGDALATVEVAGSRRLVAVHLTRPPADWKALDAAVASVSPGAGRQGTTVSVALRHEDLESAFRTVAKTAGVMLGATGSCRLDLHGGRVILAFPPDRPPDAALVWRLRKSAAPTAAGTS